MATVTQNVIIDFQADFTSVQSGIDTLEQMGMVDKNLADQFRKTNTEIKKQGDVIDITARKSQSSTQSFGKLNDLMKQFPRSGLNRFLLQIGNELAAAGVNAKDFYQKLDPKDAVTKQTTLRNELRQVKEQMQAAALAGGTLGAEYQKLKKRAGELDDTIRDVANDIKNAGSDTRNIDNVVGSISALAGGFSAVQGAAALFGDESEDLQKALLRVNAAMALATGLQQVSNALQKEGSLARLADTVSTYGQIAAQKLYAVVVGQSVGVMKLFKIALASTGIGLLVLGLVALISNMGGASKATKQLKKDLEDLRTSTDAAREAIRQEGEADIALLEQVGTAQSKISKKRIADIEEEQAAEEGVLFELDAKRKKLKEGLKANNIAEISASLKGLKLVEEQTITAENNIRDTRNKIRLERINGRTQEIDEQKKADEKRIEDQKKLNEKALADAKKRRALEFEDYQAGIELKLLAAEKGSADELDLQKQLLRAKLQIDLEGEDLTLNQRKLLIQQFFKDRIELEKKFNKDLVLAGLEDQKNRDAAILENLNLTEKEKLDVKIEYLQLSAAQEILAAEGNAAKILAINAKLNADIIAAKIESIRRAAEQELALSSATGGIQQRALERVAQDEKLKADIRINALIQLGDREQTILDRQIKANRDAAAIIGSDQKTLEIEYEQLMDKKAAKAEETEKKITDLTKAENEKRKQDQIAQIQATIQGLQGIANIIASINANEQERSKAAIDNRRTEIDELLESGAITEKEAKLRNRRLGDEEKKAKEKAARQIKNLAVFQALLAIPQAYLAGLQTPVIGAIIGPLYAAIAAVEAGIIASRPLPSFATGKKGSYQGLANVGEAGAELIQRADGSMQVATRRSMVYLGSQDKVFTAGETKRMMPFVNKESMTATNGETFNYDKLAKAVKQKQANGSVINIDKEFISESVANGLSRVNYFDRYYNSKG